MPNMVCLKGSVWRPQKLEVSCFWYDMWCKVPSNNLELLKRFVPILNIVFLYLYNVYSTAIFVCEKIPCFAKGRISLEYTIRMRLQSLGHLDVDYPRKKYPSQPPLPLCGRDMHSKTQMIHVLNSYLTYIIHTILPRNLTCPLKKVVVGRLLVFLKWLLFRGVILSYLFVDPRVQIP